MSCSKPLLFIDLGIKENGKRNLKMLPQRVDYNLRSLCEKYGENSILQIPCGKCPSCIKAYKRMWSLRCEAEAREHVKNSFITLTFDDEHCPDEISKRDLQLFFKRFRSKFGKVRYFACGEYGHEPMTGDRERPHYHAILFGCFPDDAKYFGKSKTGFPIWLSESLEKVWSNGFVTVQDFDPTCAGYVAGYVDKKMEDKDSFIVMSNRPGIGAEFYKKNIFKLYETDNFVSKNGFIAPLPRYADIIADRCFFDLSDIKDQRAKRGAQISLSAVVEHGFTNLEEVTKYNAEILERSKKYGRNL